MLAVVRRLVAGPSLRPRTTGTRLVLASAASCHTPPGAVPLPLTMRVLNVAEKNDAAKSLAGIMSGGQARRREGLSRFNKIYEFDYDLQGSRCQMVMTSVSGHLLNYDFPASYRKWRSCSPLVLFDCPVVKQCSADYEPIKRTLEREAPRCQLLVIWTDCDREGENIGFEVMDVCRTVNPTIRVLRARFSEITAASVRRAVSQLQQPDGRASAAVDVRQQLDLRIGAAFTRFQTLRLQQAFPTSLADRLVSYGSCQFPTLGFVVERYKAIQSFVPEQFWRIKVVHQTEGGPVEFSWKRMRLFDHLCCQVLFEKCCENSTATVTSVQSKPKSKWRPLPLDTVELEKLASRKLRISAKETMKLAEKLYTQGFLSYPRTETNIFPKELSLAPLVQQQTGDPNWGAFASRLLETGINPRQGKKTDNAHPPIHPTKHATGLGGNEQRLYELVTRHFLACLSADAQGRETLVEIDVAGEKFSANGLAITARNYLDVYPYDKWSDKELPVYRMGDQFVAELSMPSGETSPPPLLTEADLIALMDKHGIGTDATHAEHIETIKSRLYVGLHDTRFVPGNLGMGLVEGYDSMGFHMSKPNLRAELEADLKRICEGSREPDTVLREQIARYRAVFEEAMRQAQKLDTALSPYLGEQSAAPAAEGVGVQLHVPETVCQCPACGQPVILKTCRDGAGFLLSCSGFPACRVSMWMPETVERLAVSARRCDRCAGAPRLLEFTFRAAAYAPYYPRQHTACVAGCDAEFMETVGLRRLAAPTAGAGSRQRSGDSGYLSDSGQSRPSGANPNSQSRPSSASQRPADTSSSQSRPFSASQRPATASSSQSRPSGSASQWPSSQSRPAGSANQWPSSQSRPAGSANQWPSSQSRPAGSTNQWPSSQSWPAPGPSRAPDWRPAEEHTENRTVCSCGLPAVQLTVRKDGPNKGRRFYKCDAARTTGRGCSFFLWADDDGPGAAGGGGLPSAAPPPPPPPPPHRPLTGAVPAGSDDVTCNCGLPPRRCTVQKQGPNRGREFLGCSKPREQSCRFFQWCDEAGSAGGAAGFGGSWARGRGRGRGRGASARTRPYGRGGGGAQRRCRRCQQPGHDSRTCSSGL